MLFFLGGTHNLDFLRHVSNNNAFFVDFGLGRGRAYIFYPPWSNCGSWAGFCTPGRSWRLLGWILRSLEFLGGDSGFLAASVLDFVLVAASGLDSGLGSGFLAASRLDSGLLAACSCRGMALFLAYVSSEKTVL